MLEDTAPNEAMLDKLAGLYDVKIEDLEDASAHSLPLYSSLKEQGKRYKNEELIARGGMKDILKVFDEKTGRPIAMARLLVDAPEELYEPFLREARLTALLDHPNIISIFDIGLDESQSPYFTMELKTGKGLDKMIIDTHQNTEISHLNESNGLLEVFIKICDAIAYAHSHDILHLDLKPENIQVGKYGEVIVCDWGLGKVVGKKEDDIEFDQLLLNPDLLNNMTLIGEIKGTPGFMAPEQVQKGGVKTPQTDIYALGSILCLLLSGHTAIEGNTETILNRTVTGDLSIQLPADLPSSLNAVIRKAMKLLPEERYQSVAALRHDVHRYLTGYATEAENAGNLKQLSLLYKRNKVLCLLSCTFLILATLGTLLFINSLNNSRILAENSKLFAEKQQRQAESNLQLYLDEQQRLSSMNQHRSKELMREGRIYSNKIFFEDPFYFHEAALENIIRAVQLTPVKLELYSLKGSLLFMKQNFRGALKVFQKTSHKNVDLYEICQELDPSTLTAEGLLSIEQFIWVISRSKKFRVNYLEHMIAYDKQVRQDQVGYEKIIKALLSLANKKQNFELNYDLKNKYVSISGQGLRRLNSPNDWGSSHCLLRFLEFERLNLRYSGVTDLNQLKGLKRLKELDIRNTWIKDLSPLNEIPTLHKLVFHDKQFSTDQLAVLNKRVQLKVK
ncbi:MAG: protein kinase [Lentisphaerales bacterium]|nr:protein kinase [Lentisphaerales bacterium]